MGFCSVTRESVKVITKRHFESYVKNFDLKYPIVFSSCFVSRILLLSAPQRVVRVDALLPLRSLNLPSGREHGGHEDALSPEAFPSLFGPGFWSSAAQAGGAEPVYWTACGRKALPRC